LLGHANPLEIHQYSYQHIALIIDDQTG